MRTIALALTVLCALPAFAGSAPVVVPEPGVLAKLDGRDAVFYAIDLADGRHYAWAPERADERHTPFSSFKIPNLLIALETGVAQSVDEVRHRDPERRPAESWWSDAWREDQTLAQAFRRSTVWYFQDIALEVGGARYREMLQAFAYGNAAAPDHNDTFWLAGPLAISPREQTVFISRLVRGELPVRPQHVATLARVSLLEETEGCRLHGKTGSGQAPGAAMDGPFEGWLVGWVECPGAAPVSYALFLRGPSYAAMSGVRVELARRFLHGIVAWPTAGD